MDIILTICNNSHSLSYKSQQPNKQIDIITSVFGHKFKEDADLYNRCAAKKINKR